jgi:hypothetical protein
MVIFTTLHGGGSEQLYDPFNVTGTLHLSKYIFSFSWGEQDSNNGMVAGIGTVVW